MIARISLALSLTLALACPIPAQEDQPASAAYEHFRSAFADSCFGFDQSYFSNEEPSSWQLSWKPDYSDTERTTTLYEFFCGAGAYNVNYVYYLDDPDFGPFPVAFAIPAFDVKYVDDDFDGDVQSITVRGMTTQWQLTNPSYSPETGTITSSAKWRGIGDASSSGTWAFQQGQFVLKSYDVDASYDDEINPERILEYK